MPLKCGNLMKALVADYAANVNAGLEIDGGARSEKQHLKKSVPIGVSAVL